jgi:hypothetical protein
MSKNSAFLSSPNFAEKVNAKKHIYARESSNAQIRCAKAATQGNTLEEIRERTRLHDLFNQQGQSPWIDNLTRYPPGAPLSATECLSIPHRWLQ